MTRLITLKPYGVGRYADVSPFIIDEDLHITFEGMDAANGIYHAALTCGVLHSSAKIVNHMLTIPKESLSAGELNITVMLYLRGEKLKEWVIEPLLLKNVDPTLTAEPEVAEIRHRLAELQETYGNELAELRAELATVRASLEEAKTKIQLLEQGYDPLRV